MLSCYFCGKKFNNQEDNYIKTKTNKTFCNTDCEKNYYKTVKKYNIKSNKPLTQTECVLCGTLFYQTKGCGNKFCNNHTAEELSVARKGLNNSIYLEIKKIKDKQISNIIEQEYFINESFAQKLLALYLSGASKEQIQNYRLGRL